jgi:hypothetical protein
MFLVRGQLRTTEKSPFPRAGNQPCVPVSFPRNVQIGKPSRSQNVVVFVPRMHWGRTFRDGFTTVQFPTKAFVPCPRSRSESHRGHGTERTLPRQHKMLVHSVWTPNNTDKTFYRNLWKAGVWCCKTQWYISINISSGFPTTKF